MYDVGYLMFAAKVKRRSCCVHQTSTTQHQTSHIPPRQALTLIELLVVIVILTTLVAGVIPLLSPNNDTRKIREASRMLQTYIMRAQAEAARTGRPQGIAFRESSAGSGVALEAYRLETPPPFAGFSNASAARIIREKTGINEYEHYVQFVLAGGPTGKPFTDNFDDYTWDPLPPKLIRYGDLLDVGGVVVQLTDSDFNGDSRLDQRDPQSDYYSVLGNDTHSQWRFQCELVNLGQQTIAFDPDKVFPPPPNTASFHATFPKPYRFIRQPLNTVDAPIQFPAGIAIDLQASVVEGATTNEVPFATSVAFPTGSSLHTVLASGGQKTYADSVGIMFSPTGSVSEVLFNGVSLDNVSRIALLLGRVENGGLTSAAWTIEASASNDTLAQRQAAINWLNLDSRWLSISPSTGRVVVNENAFVDARNTNFIGTNDFETAEFQIEAAHEFAHQMRTVGAGR